MRRQEFLDALASKLSGLPREDTEERIAFYNEMIDDRIEEGLAEEEAVSEIGSVDEIAEQIIADIPFTKIAREKIKPKRHLRAWEIVLLVLGAPIWLSLAVAALAVILSVYIVLWSLIVSLWAIFGALVGCALGGVTAGIVFLVCNSAVTGLAIVGAGLVCAGLSVLLFFGCKATVKGIILLTRKIIFGMKRCFVRKGDVL